MAKRTKPWERQPGEGDRAFHAFTLYRDGQPRSLRSVTEQLAAEALAAKDKSESNPNNLPQVLTISVAGQSGGNQAATRQRRRAWGILNTWSRKYCWVARAKAWDDEVDRYIRSKNLDEFEKTRRQQKAEARAAAAVLMWSTRKFLVESQKPEVQKELDQIAIYDLHALAVQSVGNLPRIHEAERRAMGIVLHDEGDGSHQYVAVLNEVQPNRVPDQVISHQDGADSEDNPWADPDDKE